MMNNRNTLFLAPIAGLFAAVLVLSNTLDTKIFTVFGLNLPAGIILFPLGYVFGDVLTEVYGFRESRKVIWTGGAALLLMVVFYQIAIALPPASFWPNQQQFETTIAHTPRIAAASIMAYLCGEFCNSMVLARLKVASAGKNMPIRFVASTVVGQAVDTCVFVAIAFVGVLPPEALPGIILAGWLFKVLWEVIALPVSLPFASWLKRKEGIDTFDENISFNPFRLSSK